MATRKGRKPWRAKRPSRVIRRRTTRRRSKARGRKWWPWWLALALISLTAFWAHRQGWFAEWSGGSTSIGAVAEAPTGAADRERKKPPERPGTEAPSPEYTLPEVARQELPAEPDVLHPAAGVARIALVIDDLGRSVADVERIERLGIPVTYAVLPFETQTRQVAERVLAGGHELICHLPMEPANGADPGPGALTSTMSGRKLAAATRAALKAVPGAVGANNHMGSSLTTNRESMRAILRVIGNRELYFLDSRTSAGSVGYALASEQGIPTAERKVFLDGELRADWVGGQFLRALGLAREEGAAVVIGHPHDVTLTALEEWVPQAVATGYQFVPVSAVLERTGTPVAGETSDDRAESDDSDVS